MTSRGPDAKVAVRDIGQAFGRHVVTEEKIRIVLEGLRSVGSIAGYEHDAHLRL